jgi:hypothetical protein
MHDAANELTTELDRLAEVIPDLSEPAFVFDAHPLEVQE